MACDSGYKHDANGANEYYRICNKAGFKTVASGAKKGVYAKKCKKWGCVPLPSSGWGTKADDIDDKIRAKTGWKHTLNRVLVHGTGHGWPHVFPDNTGVQYSRPYCPVCVKEN